MIRTATMAKRNLNPKVFLTPTSTTSYAAICRDAMASLLRRKLVCFYCGCRSAQKQDGRVRRWQCEKCEAVNHLDEVCLFFLSFRGPGHIANVVGPRMATSQILRPWNPLRKSDTPEVSLDPFLQSSHPRTRPSSVRRASKTSISSHKL